MEHHAYSLTVDLGSRSYPIEIGQALFADPTRYAGRIAGRQVMIVTNETVAPLYLDALRLALEPHFEVQTLIVPDGERYKDFATLNLVFDALLSRRFDRRCTLVALGGGVIGDMTGFAAASYQRGVDFVQVPTTLLAQVDSSVGGKTGINHPLGKNMIGAFHQPRAVIADTLTLNTLPDRELSAGLAEVIKYGVIVDADFFSWLEASMDALRAREPEMLAKAIHRSCVLKAEVVAADERESGRRALLNLGHTFGHAIETGMGYGTWLHGEAVGAGICLASRLSARLGWIDAPTVERIENLVARAGLPIAPPAGLHTGDFMRLMAVDKKVLDGQLRLVLVRGIGQALVTSDYPQAELLAMLDERTG